jgi:transposase-like protein
VPNIVITTRSEVRKMKKKTRHTPEKKAEVVIKMLKEEETIVQIASEYGIHPNQLGRWKSEFLKLAPIS